MRNTDGKVDGSETEGRPARREPDSPCSGPVWSRERRTGSSARCSNADQSRVKTGSVPPARVWSRKWATHTLGGPVHTLGGGSSTIIQEQRLLPVVVVGLQDVPAAQFQVDAEAQVKKHKRKLECCSHLAARLFLN